MSAAAPSPVSGVGIAKGSPTWAGALSGLPDMALSIAANGSGGIAVPGSISASGCAVGAGSIGGTPCDAISGAAASTPINGVGTPLGAWVLNNAVNDMSALENRDGTSSVEGSCCAEPSPGPAPVLGPPAAICWLANFESGWMSAATIPPCCATSAL